MKKKWKRFWGRKKISAFVLLSLLFITGRSVSAEIIDFEGAEKALQEQNLQPEYITVSDGKGNLVRVAPVEDTLYVSVKKTPIRQGPGGKCRWLARVYLGTRLHRTGVSENGWSRVIYEEKGKKPVEGYVPTKNLGEETQIIKFSDTAKAVRDTEILDFPARKEGVVVGELGVSDQVSCTGMINNVWYQILYKDDKGKDGVGYVPASALSVPGMVTASADASSGTEKVEAGIIHKSQGEGIFAEAVEGVTLEGVVEGTPVSASADASLKPLGTFRITHYCPCSICCGPWANGITSTGVTAVTNHTIAVDPDQIPYGSKVVINGQVYVAEDCGGAIKENCIDIYVASHEEGESRGLYYTDVYLLVE